MKKLLLIFLTLLSIASYSQTITPVLYPQYMQGHGTSTASDEKRVPYVCRMTVSGLSPNTMYFFYNRWAADPAVSVEQGGIIFVEQDGNNWRRSTAPSLGSAANRDTLTTDATGSYTGWFLSESNIATDFTPGAQLFFRLVLDLPGGTNPIRITASQPVTVLAWDDYFDPVPAAVGTGVRSATANTVWVPKNFILLYDNVGGTGRPISGTYVESDGVANSAANGYVGWYAQATSGVNGVNSRWGTIIPDALPNGIRRIAQHSMVNGSLVNSCTDADGDWGGANGNTVDPTGGGANDPSAVRIIDCTPTGTPVCNLALSSVKTDVNCFGGSTGAIDISITGAVGAVTYSWGAGAPTTQDRTGLAAGSYTVTATDAGVTGCTATATIVIAQPASALGATATSTAATSGSNGTATVTATGGTAPYTYSWSPGGQTTATASGLAAGNYTVTVTDSKGCTRTATTSVSGPTCNLALTSTKTDVNCFGGSTGAIDVSVTGAIGAVSYSWGAGAPTTQDRAALAAGSYTVIATDAGVNGCTATATIVIAQPAAALTASATSTPVTTTGGSNGTTSVTATGGTAPYSYLWTPGGQTTASVTGRTSGAYSVTVTDSKGCTATASATVGSPSCNLALTFTKTDVNCFGGSTGAIDLSVTGASGAVTYSWGAGAPTTQDRTGLAAGSYTVTATDAAACTATLTITIAQPAAALTATATSTPVTTTGGSNGATSVTAAGGTAPYSYLWTPGGQTTASVTGRAAGAYSVTVTDSKGCTATASTTVGSPSCNLALTFIKTDVNCFGGSTGAIDISVTGASGAVTYSWGTGAPATQDRTGLSAGSYTVIATDAAGCTATLTIIVAQPTAALAATASSTPATSGSNGTATVNATGGTAPYTYSWTPGGQTTTTATGLASGNYTVTVTDSKGCTTTATTSVTGPNCALALTSIKTDVNCFGGSTGAIDISVTGAVGTFSYSWGAGAPVTQDRTGLAAGSYTVTATDAGVAGCTATATIVIAQPVAALSATATTTPATGGSNGTATVTATGGTAPYTYTWSPGGQTVATVTGLAAGTYTVTVTDSKGCTTTATATVGQQQGCALALTFIKTDVNCFGGNTGAIDLSVTGAVGAVSYSWGAGAPTTQDRTGLVAGSYTVTATDAGVAGCTATVTIVIAQPAAALSATATTTPATSGSNGTATVTATGGTAPYTYLWNPGGQTTATATGLAAGTYTVTVTDSKGCTATATVTVRSESTGCNITIATKVTNVKCYGDSNGKIDLTVNGATSPVTYKWSNGSAKEDIYELKAGTYTVTVTDAKQCTATATVTVTEPEELIVKANWDIIKCGQAITTAVVTATGGTAPYMGTGSYVKSPGSYRITVEDANGCKKTLSFTVAPPLPCEVNCTDISRIKNDFINKSVSGGKYIWFNSVIRLDEKCGKEPIIINVTNAKIKFKLNNDWVELSVPDSRITFTENISSASTEFANGKWETKAPLWTRRRDAFMAGLIYKIPGHGIPAGIKDVEWKADININREGNKIEWKWAAAAYSNFADDHAKVQVKAIDDNYRFYQDKAGTPANYRQWLIAGGTGWGWFNFTGDYSRTDWFRCGICRYDKHDDDHHDNDDERPATNGVITKGLPLNSADKLEVIASPNPSASSFTLNIRTKDITRPISVKISDVNGKLLEVYQQVSGNSILKVGKDGWNSGIYYAEIIQDNQRKVIKLVKAN